MKEKRLNRRQLLALRRRWRKQLGWTDVSDWICFVEAIPTERRATRWLSKWERLMNRLDLTYTGVARPDHLDVTLAGRGEWRRMLAKQNSVKGWLACTSADWVISDWFDAIHLTEALGDDVGTRIKDLIRWRSLRVRAQALGDPS